MSIIKQKTIEEMIYHLDGMSTYADLANFGSHDHYGKYMEHFKLLKMELKSLLFRCKTNHVESISADFKVESKKRDRDLQPLYPDFDL